MRNMENLFSRIQSLNLDTYKSLSISFNNTIQKMAKMDLHLWSQLQIAFSAASERNRPAVIREFLVLRGRLFVTTSFDYTHAPNLQANQLCVELARKVIKPGEALCQLLMPTISRVYGTHFMPEDVEPATSESEDDPFLWENYLTHVDGRSLIYVPGLYEISARNPDFLFSPKPELLALSVEDHERVRTVAGIASERYFEKLKEMFLITHNETNCVGNALRDLQRALVASSKQSSGSEFEASMIHLRRPVLDFYKIWVALSALQKNKIASYEGRSGTRSLESYLLFLFLHAKSFFSEIHVSQDQYQRVIRESIFPCADLVSQSLDDILKTHLDLFEMPLPGSKSLLQQDVLPTSGQLELMQDTLKTAVLSRSSIGGLNDVHCSALFPLVKALSSHFLNMASVAKINALIGVTKKVEDVAVVLNFLRSPGQQASYLRRICFSSGYFFFNTPRAVIIMVNRLSEENWRSFFETMNKIMPGLELVQSDLIYILNSVPKKQWSELIRVMHPCLVSIFSKNDAIASLFADMFYHQFTIDQTYELFRDALDAVLSKLRYITALLQYSDSAVWPALMQILKTLFAQHCKNKEFEVSVLQQLNLDEEKIQFLRALYSTLSNKITMTPLKIAAVMNLLSFESCKEFLNLLDANHFQYVKTANELAAFLKLLINPKRQLAFIQKIYDLHIPLEATIKNFYYLVESFLKIGDILFHVSEKIYPDGLER